MTLEDEERVREIASEEVEKGNLRSPVNLYAKGRRDGWLYAIGVGGFLLAVFLLVGG